ncbi:signal transduction histidine kinase [Nostoc sp. PCC 7524]|uniref:sensor histidine kinase n=1 Tax=Nostoc sp. (strain ATCC 29411 / PCC 7524) TaxID=28072 RepID=UPI00029F2915|nr:HAMP domain-containing sensor histidine kinase [Nostoc sp. PCC 7524]AFY47285.1 signal transduction histidine kinase [Nostoc sp. PCC 7524]
MNWSNWVYLGAGLVMGISSRWLLARSAKAKSHQSPEELTQPQHTPQILEEFKNTQLAYHMAREMSQFKAGFLARTTHELRSPLNGLIGLHQLILSDLCEDPAEEREFIGQAHERALKLLHLMDEILNVAKTEHGTNKLDIQPRPLADVLQEVYNLIYMLAVDRNLKLRILPPEPEIYVLADQKWLRQILLNLVDTGISQMTEGSICISCGIPSASNFVYIWLDLPTHALISDESIDLLKGEDKSVEIELEKTALSPGMKLLLNQNLLAVMGGKLEILPSTNSGEAEQLTRLQISMPLAILEAELLQ